MEPAYSESGEVLGALVALCREAREPDEAEVSMLRTSAHVMGIAIGHDRARRALRGGEAQMRAILDTAVDAIVTIDVEGTIESFNLAAEELFGWAADEVIGRNVRMLMPPPDSERHDDYLARYLESGERRIIGIGREVVALRKDRSTVPVDLGVSELVVDGSIRFTAMLRDLTERKRLEEEFLHAQKMEAIGRLAGGIAHDFNNLLMGVIGCCRIARETLDPEHPAAVQLREIGEAAERGGGNDPPAPLVLASEEAGARDDRAQPRRHEGGGDAPRLPR